MTEMRITRIPVDRCPHCHYEMDSASDLNGLASPSPGDVAICISCGNVLIMGNDLKLLACTPDELIEIMNSPAGAHITRMQWAVKQLALRSPRQ